MAYCNKCGAYIPDNETACFACGYDEGAAAAQAQQQENERAAAEERRRKQQEFDRKWAEAEFSNRQKQKAESDRWAEAEAVRRRREEEARQRWEAEKARRAAAENNQRYRDIYGTARDISNRTINTTRDVFRNQNTTTGGRKLMSVLAYFDILFLVPLLLAKDDGFAQFHAKQGMRLFIFNAITTALTAVAPVAGLLKLLGLYCFIKGVGNALNDRAVPLPYIGNFKF